MRPSTADSARTAIVTGGASGIGYAIAQRLADDGALVAVFDIDGGAVESAAESIAAAGGKGIGLRVDVSDRAEIDAAVVEVRARLGKPAILINCAGVTVSGPFSELTVETWNNVLSVNLTGT